MDGPFKALPELDISDLSDLARWLRGITTATQVLVTHESLEQGIRTALGCIGQASQVEVVSILQANNWGIARPDQLGPSARSHHPHDSTQRSLVLRSRWSRNDELADTVKTIDAGRLDAIWHPLVLRWQKEWLAGRVIYGQLENFPSKEQKILAAQGVEFLVALPIQVQRPTGPPYFWGVLGLEAKQSLDWSLTKISALRSVAACIGGVIARDSEQQGHPASNHDLQEKPSPGRQPTNPNSKLSDQKSRTIECSVKSHSPKLLRSLAEHQRQTKQGFLLSIEQKLSQPLQEMLGQTQHLNRTLKLEATEEQGLAKIHQYGSQLLQQIHWILDLDHLKSGGLSLTPSSVHFPSFLQGIIEICRAELEQAGLLLVYQPELNLPLGVDVDVARLKQVLMALLRSAIGEGHHGQITFSIRRLSHHDTSHQNPSQPSANRLHFSVTKTARDPDEVTSALIDVESHSQDEAGLEIAVAQKLVMLMGGKSLPEPWVSTSHHWGFELELLAQFDWPQKMLDSWGAVGYEGARRRILIVDDRWENRGALTSLLAPLGFEICEAMDGQDGLKRLRSFQPDLVITDLVMPVLDGFTMLAKIRAQAEWEELSILVSSASADLREQQRSLKLGGDDFLTKPVQLEELLGLLEKHLSLRWIYSDEMNASK